MLLQLQYTDIDQDRLVFETTCLWESPQIKHRDEWRQGQEKKNCEADVRVLHLFVCVCEWCVCVCMCVCVCACVCVCVCVLYVWVWKGEEDE